MGLPVIDTEKEIADLEEQIRLVKKESHRLTEAEWVILQMLERSVEIMEALDERTRSHRNRLNRLTGDGR